MTKQIKMFSMICLMLLSHSIFVMSTRTSDDNASKPKSIFILAGQSNMAGRGGMINETPTHPTECEPNVQILRLNGGLTWEEAQDPLHGDIDDISKRKLCGVGPGMSFANSVLNADPNIGVIGLVPCAVGGTRISQWAPGGELYNRMLSRATEALKAGGGQIRALLWYQGESDAESEADALAYKRNLETLLTRLRSDLQLPNLPVIEVAIAEPGEKGKFIDIVREAQLGINLPNVKCVDAKGLEVNSLDKLHLTTPSQVKLGQMLANTFLQYFH